MASMTLPQTSQMIVTLESDAITPAIRRSINKARREYAKGETIKCSTPEEMQRYFNSIVIKNEDRSRL